MLEYNPRDPSQQQTGIPFDLLRRVREQEPVTRLTSGSWFVTRQAEVIPVLKDVETFRTDLGPLSGVGGVEDLDERELFLSEILEPRHGKLRRLYNSCFGPHRVARLEPFVETTCGELLDGMLAHDPADLHGEYALQIPSRVMARAMGLPDDAAAKFMAWSYDATLMLRSVSPGIGDAGVPIQRYFADALTARRAMADPPDDVTTFLLTAEIDGEPLTDQEIVAQLQFMVMAGVHTTRTLLTHLVHRLLEFPDLFDAVQRDRDLVVPLIEESLRHDSPVPATSRRLTADTEVGGCPMHEGEWIEVGVMSANHDDAVYPDADAFLLDRLDARDHLGFGTGPHVCPGATLARLEARTAVNVLLNGLAGMTTVAGAEYPPLPSMLDHRPIPAHLSPSGTGLQPQGQAPGREPESSRSPSFPDS